MSVRTMARVWKHSQHVGTELLMLLAIADFANDDGDAYPAVGTLAKKCRITPRHANRILSALRNSGELQVLLHKGRVGTNRYRIMLVEGTTSASPLTPASSLTPASPLTSASPLTPESPLTAASSLTAASPRHVCPAPLTPASPAPGVEVPSALTHTSDEPSLNHEAQAAHSVFAPRLYRLRACEDLGR